MSTTTGIFYHSLTDEQRTLFNEMYQKLTEFNSLMNTAVVAHSSELSHPYRAASEFYNPLFANIQFNFEEFKISDFVYLSKLLLHLQSRFHSGMINKAMRAYNVLILIIKDLKKFSQSMKVYDTMN